MSKRGAYVYQQIEQSTAEWTADSTIYPPSLWLFERLANGNLNMKFSDGIHTYSELPLVMQDIKVRINPISDYPLSSILTQRFALQEWQTILQSHSSRWNVLMTHLVR